MSGRPVYSTDPGFVPPCEVCGEPPERCRCREAAPPAAAGPVRIRLERKGRAGKAVTVVEGLPGSGEAIEETARALKAACAAGGTVKGRTVEIQGDHRDRAAEALRSRGLTVKRG